MEHQLKQLENLALKTMECNDSNEFINEINTVSSISSDIGVDLEIVFRNVLDTYVKRAESKQIPLAREHIVKLLDCAIDVGIKFANLSPNCPKIPFILIQDILDGQTISHAAETWEIVESMVDTLTQPDLFNRGKYVILRTCNSLLKRLSKSCHTEFCGRVLMFLAAIYPLSEKSAVNLGGKVNTSNITGYEEEEQYVEKQQLQQKEHEDEVEDNDNAHVDGNEADAMQEANEGEDAVTVSASSKDDRAVSHKRRGEGAAIDYDYGLYKTFWDIQKYLSADPKTLEGKTIWNDILASAATIIGTFEGHSFRKSEVQLARDRRNESKTAAMRGTHVSKSVEDDIKNSHVYMGCKYLTSSQLFSLELKDPSIRQQVCTQLLILIHHKLRTLASTPPANQIVIGKGPQVQPVTQPTEKELVEMETRILALIESTPPNGEDLARTLRMIFDGQREARWIQWKADHCFNYEKNPEEVTQTNSVSKKRKAPSSMIVSTESSYYFDHQLEDMQRAAKSLSEKVPELDTFVEDFLDAEDPEAGIEEEYHPKNDTVYCWRARRLMASKKLSVFEQMSDGSVAKGLDILFPGKIGIGKPEQEAGVATTASSAMEEEEAEIKPASATSSNTATTAMTTGDNGEGDRASATVATDTPASTVATETLKEKVGIQKPGNSVNISGSNSIKVKLEEAPEEGEEEEGEA